MFLLKNQLGEDIRNVRKELNLSREKLAALSRISVKTIYHLEKGNRIGKIETFFKIKNALQKNFDLDLAKRAGIKIVWDLQDLDQEGLEIIEGGLLGDGCIAKCGVYRQEAKDKRYLEWLGKLLNENGIKSKVIPTENKGSYSENKTFYLLYTYSCPAFFELRKRWYIWNDEGKETKRIPADIRLTPITLLHWYLGDGNFKRDNRELPRGGRPCVRLFTNDFLREDVEFVLRKLKESLGLNFYILPKFNKYKEKGHSLHLHPKDLFKFFKIVGLEPPQEIKNSITKEILIGKAKGRISTFGKKWPNEADWIRILAKTKSIGKLLKEKRKRLSLTQRGVAGKINVTQHHVSEIETGRKYIGSKRFEKVLDLLRLNINKLLDNLYIE